MAPATGAVNGSDLSFLHGFTVVSFGDASIGNHELEGTLAVGGNVTFDKGYPMVHSTGLAPTGYALPRVGGDPTRLLVGGRFNAGASAGVSELSSAGNITADQLGFLKLGDTSNVSLNNRGNGGIWVSAKGTSAGTEPAIYVPDRIGEPISSVAAPGAFRTTFAGAQSQASLLATNLEACSEGVATSLQPGPDAGSRRIALTAGKTNVLTVDSSELGNFFVDLTGAALGPQTTLVVNVTGDLSNVTLPKFLAATSPNAQNPNQVAPYVLWNFGTSHSLVGITGDLISGSVLAPNADVHLSNSSPLEGQLVSDKLTTSGGEIHNYTFAGVFACGASTSPTTHASTAPSSATSPTGSATATAVAKPSSAPVSSATASVTATATSMATSTATPTAAATASVGVTVFPTTPAPVGTTEVRSTPKPRNRTSQTVHAALPNTGAGRLLGAELAGGLVLLLAGVALLLRFRVR